MGLNSGKGSFSEVDLAYGILLEAGHPIYFRDLISKVLETKGGPVASLPHAMAEIHTLINMDSRFAYMGNGKWGLAEWLPQRGVRHYEEPPSPSADANLRREKLLEEIQEDFACAASEPEEEIEDAGGE